MSEFGREVQAGIFREKTRDALVLGGLVLLLGGIFVYGLPHGFSWGDHTAYYYRIVDTHSIGLSARAYSLWSLLGKPFLASWPGVGGYHVYLTALWLAQIAVLYRVLRFLGAGTAVSAALVFAHALGYPLRSVGLVSSPKVFWLILFDLLVVALVRLEDARTRGRLGLVLLLWGLCTLAHRFGVIAAAPLFLALGLLVRRRKLFFGAAVGFALVVATVAIVMLMGRSGGIVRTAFADEFELAVPANLFGTLSSIVKVVGISGLLGGIVLLSDARRIRWIRPPVVFLVTFAAGCLAFAVLFPTGEKAMFVLPALHAAVLLGGMAAREPLRRPAGKAIAIVAGSVLTAAALPWLARAGADVSHLDSPYHDYGDGIFGLASPRPGIDYANDLVKALPSGAVLHADWGVKPMLRALVREGAMPAGIYIAHETEPTGADKNLVHYLVRSPWMRLPERDGAFLVLPVESLAKRGFVVGRLTEANGP